MAVGREGVAGTERTFLLDELAAHVRGDRHQLGAPLRERPLQRLPCSINYTNPRRAHSAVSAELAAAAAASASAERRAPNGEAHDLKRERAFEERAALLQLLRVVRLEQPGEISPMQ